MDQRVVTVDGVLVAHPPVSDFTRRPITEERTPLRAEQRLTPDPRSSPLFGTSRAATWCPRPSVGSRRGGRASQPPAAQVLTATLDEDVGVIAGADVL
jgi:hypothetical protein